MRSAALGGLPGEFRALIGFAEKVEMAAITLSRNPGGGGHQVPVSLKCAALPPSLHWKGMRCKTGDVDELLELLGLAIL